MSPLAISIHQVSKKYKIGLARHDTLRDQLAAAFSRAKPANHSHQASEGEIWALSDISFDIQHGEVIGIIGRNGAGKSTLLKILSRITEPTSGRIEIYGRVGSLLEVGTGFHPELSGRENIYLNGAILGMTRNEINRKFDEIVDFADIEKFLDTPVKRYSSGMYVRLAFAVAAHLEPEILLVDEVLAVGDVAFQRKCLGKMSAIAGEGRTVLFVSHNMAAIQTQCTRGIYLRDGKVVLDDPIDKVVAYYLSMLEQSTTIPLAQRSDRGGRGATRLLGIEISRPVDARNTGEWSTGALATGHPAQFKFNLSAMLPDMSLNFTIYDQQGNGLAFFRTWDRSPQDLIEPDLGNDIYCEIDELLLLPGDYRVGVDIWRGRVLEDSVEAAAYFKVEQGQLRGRPIAGGGQWAKVSLPYRWRIAQ